MRPPVDQDRIEKFLSALGRELRVKVRLYLAGGAELVWLALKPQTVDIDIAYELDPKDHSAFVEAVRKLKDSLQINVEEASPADFMPLPTGHKERATWVAKFGTIDVFLYDAVSTVLAKVHRGTDADFADVLALMKRGLVSREALQKAYDEILPKMGAESLKQDPEKLKRGYEELLRRLTPA